MTDFPERPALAPDVELVGAVDGNAFAESQYLVRRGETFVQVGELLYRAAEQLDGSRTLDEIAERLTELTPWLVTRENVEQLIERKLVPLGLVAAADGSVQRRDPGPSALQVMARMKAVGPVGIERVARFAQVLFTPVLLVPMLVLLAGAHAWLYLRHGVGEGLVQLIYRPALVVPVLGVLLLSGVVHEFGHASALRYGGGRARSMGFGFYLIYPAFYTDTSEAYRLGRWARVRVDLGGFYFHLIFAAGLMGLALLTGAQFLLVAVLLINLEVFRQLLFPFVRFDGYWLLADLTGIRDLYSYVLPPLARLVSRGRIEIRTPPMRRWAKLVLGGFAALAIPVLAGLAFLFVTRGPTYLGIFWDSIGVQRTAFVSAAQADDALAAAAAVLQLLILLLPIIGGVVVLTIVSRQLRRAIGALRAAAAAASGSPAAARATPAESPLPLAEAVHEHLLLKRRNASLEQSMPLSRYTRDEGANVALPEPQEPDVAENPEGAHGPTADAEPYEAAAARS